MQDKRRYIVPHDANIKDLLTTLKTLTSVGMLVFLMNALLVADILLTHYGYQPLCKLATWAEAMRLPTPAHVIVFAISFGIVYLLGRIISLFLLLFFYTITPLKERKGFVSYNKIISEAIKNKNEVLLKVFEQYRANRFNELDLFYSLVVLNSLVVVELYTGKGSLVSLFGEVGHDPKTCALVIALLLILAWLAAPTREDFFGEYNIPIDEAIDEKKNESTLAIDKEHQRHNVEHIQRLEKSTNNCATGVAAPTQDRLIANKQHDVLPPHTTEDS